MTDKPGNETFAGAAGRGFGRGVGILIGAVGVFLLFMVTVALIVPDGTTAGTLAEAIAALDWKVVAVLCAGIIGGAIMLK